MIDDILMQEAREQLRDQDLDAETIEESLADMREAGMFDIPGDHDE